MDPLDLLSTEDNAPFLSKAEVLQDPLDLVCTSIGRDLEDPLDSVEPLVDPLYSIKSKRGRPRKLAKVEAWPQVEDVLEILKRMMSKASGSFARDLRMPDPAAAVYNQVVCKT